MKHWINCREALIFLGRNLDCISSHDTLTQTRITLRNTPDHLSLDSAPNLGPLISRWELNKFESPDKKSVKILDQQFLSLSSSQRDMSGPILAGALSNNR